MTERGCRSVWAEKFVRCTVAGVASSRGQSIPWAESNHTVHTVCENKQLPSLATLNESPNSEVTIF